MNHSTPPAKAPGRPRYQRILLGAAAGLAGGILLVTHPDWLLLILLTGVALMQRNMLRRSDAVMSMGRSAIYLQIMAMLAVLAALGFVALRDAGVTLTDLGLVGANPAVALGLGVAAGLGLALLAEAADRLLRHDDSSLMLFLLPRSTGEKILFVPVSLMAGFAEELVFRGFMIHFITDHLGSAAIAVLLSSLMFGLVHGYQRLSGVLRTGLIGLALAGLYLWQGSLLMVMAAHATFDIVAGLLLGPDEG